MAEPVASETKASLTSRAGFRLGLLAVVVIAIGIGVWMFITAGRESTDDAQVDAHLTPIAARVGGTVLAEGAGRRQPAGGSGRGAGRNRSARLSGGRGQGRGPTSPTPKRRPRRPQSVRADHLDADRRRATS